MSWAVAGSASLLTALVLTGFGATVSVIAGLGQEPRLAGVGRRALGAAAGAVVLASVCLEAAILTHDFRIAYVAEHTDRSLSGPLLASTFYSGQEGSLLYWTLILTLLSAASVAGAARAGVRLSAYATAILSALAGFFLVVLVFVASPFDVLSILPPDGLGLNPVLRDGGMLIHPPFLLAGFASFAIPFAFAMAALLARRDPVEWIAATRRVALVAWGLQSAGLTLGMWWAYHVLGWGGYWGWDPVENVALLPWLVTTAYVHSVQVQERRGQLRAWNLGLVIAAFLLSVFGTFLVRSGAVVSVHTFAVSDIGPWFFGLLVVVVAFSFAVLAGRSGGLKPVRPMQSVVSREGAFLLQNLLLAGLVVAVLWGTVLPLVSGSLGPQKVVGASYYERVTPPLFLALLLLLAVGPLVPWRRQGSRWLRRLTWPALAVALMTAVLLALGIGLLAALGIGAAAGVTVTAVREYVRGGLYARRLAGSWPVALVRLLTRHRRRYAAHLAHLGVAVLAAGLAGSHALQASRTVTLTPGQSVAVAGRTLTLSEAVATTGDGGLPLEHAVLTEGGSTIEPTRRTYPGGQPVSRVAIESNAIEDLYVVLNGVSGDQATLTVFVNPMVTWVWAGAGVVILGILLGNLGGGRQAFRAEVVAAPVPAT